MRKFIYAIAVLAVLCGQTRGQISQDTINRDTVGGGGSAGDFLPLSGGTMTGVLVLDNLGLSQPALDINPTCGVGNYLIYSDLSETKWKKCENGTVSDLGSAGGSGDITDVGACTAGACAVEGGNDIFPFIYEGIANLSETTFQVADPTADRTVTFPDAGGEVSLLGQTISDAELVSNYSGVGSCTNQFVRATNDNAAPTCESIVDADVPDTITASNYCALSGGVNCIMTGPTVLDDTSLQIQEGVDTMTIIVPILTAARAVTFPDAAGEVSLLGQTISIGEVTFDPIEETELDTISELNTQITDSTILTKNEKFTDCLVVENLAAADDNMLFGSFMNAVTITDIWCNYNGAAPTTVAQVSLEDGAGNPMTHTTPVCAAPATVATAQSVTAANTLTAREVLRFDVDNAVSPETDAYMICVGYMIN